MSSYEAEDADGLTPVKDDNEVGRQKYKQKIQFIFTQFLIPPYIEVLQMANTRIRRITSALIAAAIVATSGAGTTATSAFPTISLTASADATAPNLYSASYTTDNPYAKLNLYGQCTWYAWGRVREVTGVKLNPYSNAKTWADSARADGLTVSNTPRANSVIVWGANSKTAYGHVGYVESVSGEYITFSHANWGNALYDNAYTAAA